MTDVTAGTAYEIPSFGGLNLGLDPEEAGATVATDLSNVDFDRQGRVCARWGWTLVKAVTMTTPAGLAAFSTTSGTRQVVIGHTTAGTSKYEAYASTGGAAVASQTVGASVISAARIGTTANEYLYLANGVDTAWRWTGAAFSQPAGMPIATYLATTPTSNRLVAANITGTSISRVAFSDAGAPETWGANNFVTLRPGDGSPITGLATWQNYVFAFKADKYFVFTGESTDGSGNPIFNYVTVDGFGTRVPPVAGREGVYIFDGQAIYLAVGGQAPRRISTPIEPFLTDRIAINGEFVLGSTQSTIRLSYSLGRLYVSFTESLTSTRRCLVYDPRVDAWTYYTTHLYFAADLQVSTDDQGFTYWLADTGVARFQPGTSIDDNGTPFTWFWKSGWYEPAPGRVATSLESSIDGSGSLTLQVANDFGALDTGSLTVISSPGVLARGWQGVDREGRIWQHQISGTGTSGAGAFANSLTHYITHVR